MNLVQVKFDILSFMTALGIFQGFFLAFLVLKIQGGNRTANRILSVFLINFSVCMLCAVVIPKDLYLEYTLLAFQSRLFRFLVGPLLYFYVRTLTALSAGFKRKDALHMFPALIMTGHNNI